MSTVCEDGTGPKVWTAHDRHGVVSNLPLLLVPDGVLDATVTSLVPGASISGEIPYTDPFAFYVDVSGSVGTCWLRQAMDHPEQGFLIEPVDGPDLGDVVDAKWKNEIRKAEILVVCAYTDIFLAAFIGENRDHSGQQLHRLLRTSLLGISKVLTVRTRVI